MREAVIIYMDYHTEEHKKTLIKVEKTLKENHVNYSAYNRNKLSKKILNVDLVVVIGGDGTFLKTGHFIENQLVIGVNSDINNKEGFLMQCNRKNFEIVLDKWINNNFKIKKLTRLKAKLNGKKIQEYALNEVYIGTKKPYQMSRYNISISGKSETQKSSGVLIGTPFGSNAWIKSANGKVISKGFEFVVREPYDGQLFKHTMKNGVLNDNEKVIIQSKMNNGIVVLDALSKEYPFKDGDILEVSVGENLKYIEVEDTPKH